MCPAPLTVCFGVSRRSNSGPSYWMYKYSTSLVYCTEWTAAAILSQPKATAHDDLTLRGATTAAAATRVTSNLETQEVTARRLKDQATALHKAGEYEEAAKEFSKAAALLQGMEDSSGYRRALPPASPSLLSVVRCSLAAAQLKVRGPPLLCLVSSCKYWQHDWSKMGRR